MHLWGQWLAAPAADLAPSPRTLTELKALVIPSLTRASALCTWPRESGRVQLKGSCVKLLNVFSFLVHPVRF